MQNVPISDQHKTMADKWKVDAAKNVNFDSTVNLFDELMSRQAEVVSEQLETAEVASDEKMVQTAAKTVTPEQDSEEHEVGTPAEMAPEEEAVETPPEEAANKKMTAEDVRKVEDDLKEYGFSEKEIERLEEMAESEDGLTWGQFVSFIAQKMGGTKGVELSGEQLEGLKSFLNKLGFDQKGSAKVLELLKRGDRDKALEMINEKLNSLADNQNIKLDKNEIEAFVTAMGLTKEGSAKVRELLGKAHLPKDMKEAFSEIRQELKAAEDKNRNLVRAVGEAVAAAMDDEDAKNSSARHVNAAVDMQQKANTKDAALGRQADDLLDRNGTQGNQQGAKQTNDKADAAMKSFMEQPESEGDDQKATWRNFFAQMREDRTGAQAKLGNAVRTAADLTASAGQSSEKASAHVAMEKTAAPRMARQVETAILKNLGQGTKQLTMQLNPENLGKLNVILQTKGDEVRALIRADNPDSARMIADQLESIRASLENQGLKVAKLDVQAGLTGNQDSMNWFGDKGHNLAREREEAARMRSQLRMMRGEAAELAQDVNSLHDKANLTQQGLHIVA